MKKYHPSSVKDIKRIIAFGICCLSEEVRYNQAIRDNEPNTDDNTRDVQLG
jgi:hypothetical protein